MMGAQREQRLQDLIRFLRTIQKPNRPIDSVGVNEGLVASGLIDSLAIVQIVVYLEQTYGIDFAAGGFDPDRLATMASILDLIEETCR
ncbi:MAG: phosphopantetheine-binding protein [Methylophilaceae bacterium]|nr:phosphopantetheine-binding protein [Methylophilaceae bacterium]